MSNGKPLLLLLAASIVLASGCTSTVGTRSIPDSGGTLSPKNGASTGPEGTRLSGKIGEMLGEIYEISTGEIEEEENSLRRDSRIWIPLIFSTEKGKYSGRTRLTFCYTHSYNGMGSDLQAVGPLGLFCWGKVDDTRLSVSLPLLTGRLASPDTKIWFSLPLLSMIGETGGRSAWAILPLLTGGSHDEKESTFVCLPLLTAVGAGDQGLLACLPLMSFGLWHKGELDFMTILAGVYSQGPRYCSFLWGLLHSRRKTTDKVDLTVLPFGLLYRSTESENREYHKSRLLWGLVSTAETDAKKDYSYRSVTPLFAVERTGRKRCFRLLHFIRIPMADANDRTDPPPSHGVLE